MRALGLLALLTVVACDGAFTTNDADFYIPTAPLLPSRIDLTPPSSSSSSSGGFGAAPGGASSRAYLDVVVGDRYSCAIDAQSALVCWGDVSRFRDKPAAVTELSIGPSTACGVETNGALTCWGAVDGSAPIGAQLTKVHVGKHFACGLDPERHPYCWGSKTIAAPANEVLDDLAVEDYGAAGLRENGELVTWSNGEANVLPEERFFAIAASGDTLCAIRRGDSTVHCWGTELRGLQPLGAVTQIAVTPGKVCGIATADGRIRCAGLTSADPLFPPPRAFSRLSIGATHGCGVLRDDGLALCWGSNIAGESDPP